MGMRCNNKKARALGGRRAGQSKCCQAQGTLLEGLCQHSEAIFVRARHREPGARYRGRLC